MTNGEIVIRGFVGGAATGLGAWLMSPAFEHGLRLAVLSSGLVASVVSTYYLIRKNRQPRKTDEK